MPGDPRAAKKALAAAARERRKYERQEVRRFTKRSRRRRIAWSIGLGAIAALVVVVAVGAYSPLMALREVRVEGAQRVPAADIQAAFGPTLGTPLPLIASSDVHEVLSAFPLIETYSTETIPPGTLVVRIVERTPVGVIETGEGLALVDAAGVVIERPAERPEGQPLITADGGIAGEGFRAAAAVIRSLPADVRATARRGAGGDPRRRPARARRGSERRVGECRGLRVQGGGARSTHGRRASRYGLGVRRLVAVEPGHQVRRMPRGIRSPQCEPRFATRGRALRADRGGAPTVESGIAYSAKL